PFLHAGMEFCRTKNGNHNSYKSADSINQIDWSRKNKYDDVFEYFKNLIRLRKSHPAFRMTSTSDLQKSVHFCTEYKLGIVGYCIDGAKTGDSWKQITLIFNGNRKEIVQPLPKGTFRIMITGDVFNDENQGEMVSGEVKVDAISWTLLVKTEN
ncbi:MAG: DUF3372 domain-containing protein, partial [Mariniphaga sp.]|nr:DUF3372 domain-containing protein [Mariniphaga sp.]